MSDEILKKLVDVTCDSRNSVEFIWHGGEPLLVGIDFYQKVVDYESLWSSKGCKVFNSIQTNGTLLNEKWIDFLVKNNFSIGLSIDGPMEFHDQTISYCNGGGSFKKTMESVHLLQEADILSNVICCVSSVNCGFCDEIFDFFINHNIKKLKFLQVQGRDEQGTLLPYSIDALQYADFLIGIFNKWIRLDDRTVDIREIKSIISALLGGGYRECMFAGECHKYFTVYPDSSVYGCDSLPKVEALRFGHLNDGLEKIEVSPNFLKFKQRTEELKQHCISCEWFNICRGECLQDWWPDIYHPQTKNHYCVGLKKIFTVFKKTLCDFEIIKG